MLHCDGTPTIKPHLERYLGWAVAIRRFGDRLGGSFGEMIKSSDQGESYAGRPQR